MNDTNPSIRWPGTSWERMVGFLWGSDESSIIGATGGSKTITLDDNNLPKGIPVHYSSSSGQNTGVNRFSNMAIMAGSSDYDGSALVETNSSNKPINIMPPHTNIYTWKRIG